MKKRERKKDREKEREKERERERYREKEREGGREGENINTELIKKRVYTKEKSTAFTKVVKP